MATSTTDLKSLAMATSTTDLAKMDRPKSPGQTIVVKKRPPEKPPQASILAKLFEELSDFVYWHRATIQTILTLLAMMAWVGYKKMKKATKTFIPNYVERITDKRIAAVVPAGSVEAQSVPPSHIEELKQAPVAQVAAAQKVEDPQSESVKKKSMNAPLPAPLVLAMDAIPVEGEDSELAEVCRWQTLLGQDGSRSDSLTVGVATVFPKCPPSSHAHTHDEIYYIISGDGITQIGGVDHHTPAGTVVFIPGGVTHGFRNTGDVDAKLLYAFQADSFSEVEYDHSGNPIDTPESAMLDTVVLHESDCSVEGQGTAFSGKCTWRTLCSADRMPTAKLTVAVTEVPVGSDDASGPHNATVGLHEHEEAEMYYIIEGEGMMTMNHITQKVKEGSTVFIPGGTQHSLYNTGDTPLRFVDVIAADSMSKVDFKFKMPRRDIQPHAATANTSGARSAL